MVFFYDHVSLKENKHLYIDEMDSTEIYALIFIVDPLQSPNHNNTIYFRV